jgi:hypothetical protein
MFVKDGRISKKKEKKRKAGGLSHLKKSPTLEKTKTKRATDIKIKKASLHDLHSTSG